MIYDLLDMNTLRNNIKDKYSAICDYNKTTSIHFRYGDYKQYPDKYAILNYQYYETALLHVITTELSNISDTCSNTILVFYEKIDSVDVFRITNQLKHHPVISQLNFIYIDTSIPDWEQLLIMSNCKHNIIANSTFSWWGAFFNSNSSTHLSMDNINSIICYPSVWYRTKLAHINVAGLSMPHWKKILTT